MFKENSKGQLIVDNMYYVDRYHNYMVEICGEYYILSTPYRKESDLRKVEKKFAEKFINEPVREYNYPCINVYKRCGYDIKVGRGITFEELIELKDEYNLSDEDISKPYETTKGAIFGEESMKKYTCICIHIKNAIELEEELIKKGIEVGNIGYEKLKIKIENE